MTERELSEPNFAELLKRLFLMHTELTPNPMFYLPDCPDGKEAMKSRPSATPDISSMFPILNDVVSAPDADEKEARRVVDGSASDEVDPPQIDESDFVTIPWSPPISRYDPDEAFAEFRPLLLTRALEDIEDLLTLFCAAQFVRLNRTAMPGIEDLDIFLWCVLISAPTVAARRPLPWIQRELDSISRLMLRHEA
ncbi:hypothetical protein HFO49_26120 [Rhizobium leguminosarum]|uniref:hypothetical protein n=1 Tax=Rhizobium leguminosarum TaxID=384 RepID=UPI001C98169B|nr:hypothetical protein [Rhizobium leguminosarum]MBY5590921.1 hypothetical protein [Rhizobium leguminosarum]